MGLSQFVDDLEETELSLVVVNRESPRPLQQLLRTMFENQSVDVEAIDVEDDVQDMVYLVDNGEIRASSPLTELQNSILLVNSDL